MTKFGTALIALILFLAAMCLAPNERVATAGPQQIPAPTPARNVRKAAVGFIKGVLYIANLKSDVSLDCKDIEVEARQLDGQKVLRKAVSYGGLQNKQCRYYLENVPAGPEFQLNVVKPKNMEDNCSQHSFEADGTLPMKIKTGQHLVRDLTIRNITCTVVK